MDTNKEFAEPTESEVVTPEAGGQTAVEEPAAGEQPLTPEQLAELKAQAAKAQENWDKLLRTAADFENYKKRAARERQEITKYANESLLERLIPVLDSFENALNATGGAPPTSVESLQQGIQMIHQQLKSILSEAGLEEIDAANKAFDPNWHEAMAQLERADMPEGQVAQQIRKGYKLRDRLLRPAGVVVAKAPTGKT